MDAIKLKEIMKKYSILFAVYFGSYGTSYYNSESDIDIAIMSSSDLSSIELNDLLTDLSIYHKKTEIDLVDLKKAEPVLRNEVARNGRILYEVEYGSFEGYALYFIKQYCEAKDYLEHEEAKIKSKIKEFLKNEG